MSLQSGTRLGPYEILGSLGSGGMGEVYRAHDPRFGREVAIKVLPPHLTADQDRLARFEQEARSVGVLNHPNILSVYDVGREDGSPYLVSELLEGETLRQKIGKDGLPYRKTIDYALQIARGLAAAHEKGIVHRDLKPENIFITKDGRAKILDFGLAKLTQREVPSGQLTQLPTTPGTEPGTVLGTMGYMSPEQVRGRHADHRADIFTFGAILYEMLTGQKAFRGETAADTMSEILTKEPSEITQTGKNISPAMSRVVQHCLEKDPEQRFQSATDIAFAIESLSSPSDPTLYTTPQTAIRGSTSLVWKIVSAVAILGLLVVSFLYFRNLNAPKRVIHSSIEVPDAKFFLPDEGGMAVASDASQLAFVMGEPDGKQHIWVRSMNEPAPRKIPETEEGYYPFFSPDGRWLAFFSNGKLKKINLAGGLPQTICDASSGRGATWSTDGIILYAPGAYGPLYKVSASGGKPEQVTPTPEAPTVSYRWPFFLRDGKHFLFTSINGKEEGIFAGSLDSKEIRRINSDPSNAAHIPEGYLIFHRDGNLMAQRYNIEESKLQGEPLVALPDRINYDETKRLANFSVASNGILAYWSEFVPSVRLVWRDRSGKETPLQLQPDTFGPVRISPDGGKISVQHFDRQSRKHDLWIHEIASGRTTRLNIQNKPFDAGVWSLDQGSIFYSTGRRIIRKSVVDLSEQIILDSERWLHVGGLSKDGKTLICGGQAPNGNYDLWLVATDGSQKYQVFLETQYNEDNGYYSPDGKWIAYTSDSSGQFQVYVRSTDGSNRQFQVSEGPGIIFRWGAGGNEIYYFKGDKIYAAQVSTQDNFQVHAVREIFTIPRNSVGGDVAPDGQQMLTVLTEQEAISSPFRLVVNWTEILKNK
jgi:serine/threonine protein kinase